MQGITTGFGRLPANDAAILGEAIWSGIPDGTVINMTAYQKTLQDKFKKAGITAYVPWLSLMDEYVQKAIHADPHMEKHECDEFAVKAKEEIDHKVRKYFEGIYQKADNTTDSSFMHVIVDESVTYLYKRAYPFQGIIPVSANKGKTASWDSVGPFEITDANFGSEDPDLQESDITSHTRTDTIKYMYAVGRLTKAVKLAGLAQVPVRDIKAIRIDLAQDSLRSLRERSMLGVSRSLTSIDNSFAAATNIQYAGIYELITNASAYAYKTYEDVSASSVDTYGEIMTYLDKTYTNMAKMNMQPNFALCDYKTFGIIRRGLAEYFRYNGEPVKTLIPGVSKIDLVFPNQGGLALVPHTFLPMTTGAYGCIFLLDTRLIERRVLWQDTYEELANINTSDKFVISAAETLIERSDIDGTSSLQGGLFGITV